MANERDDVFEALWAERARQDEQWGGFVHDDYHTGPDWARFIERFVNLAYEREMVEPEWYDAMLKATVLGVAALEAHARTYGLPEPCSQCGGRGTFSYMTSQGRIDVDCIDCDGPTR